MDMSSLQEELRGFDGFVWLSHLGQEQKQRERLIRAVAKLSTVPEDTVLDEDMKQLPSQPAMFFTERAPSTPTSPCTMKARMSHRTSNSSIRK